MMIRGLVLVSILGSSFAAQALKFEDWVEFHGKKYDGTSEQSERRAVYESNVDRWERLNVIPGGAFYGPEDEPHADLTPEEFVQVRANCAAPLSSSSGTVTTQRQLRTTTRSHNHTETIVYVDWRDKDGLSYVTPPKNQGAHGTCWSFAAAENLEGLNVRQGNPLVNISEQEFISCCPNCQGRSQDVTFEWLLNTTGGRPALESSYPYDGNTNVTCHLDAPRAPVELHSWGRITDDGTTGIPILMGLSYRGPMSLGVDARCFFGYKGGVIRHCSVKNPGCNHAVSMVAAGRDMYYSKDGGLPILVDYFTIKNSWGTKWGEGGYVRIEQGKDWWGPVATVYTE